MREQIIVRDIITTAEAAKAFRVAPSTINGWRQQNVGPPYFKLAGAVFYNRAELRAWFETRRRQPQPHRKPSTRSRMAVASRSRKTDEHVTA